MSEEQFSILLVDDDEVDRLTIKRALKKAGLAVNLIEVENGQNAIAKLEFKEQHLVEVLETNNSSPKTRQTSNDFDLILIDYRLPDIDGLELIAEIKAINLDLPIIVLTGQGDEEIAVKIMKAGAADYLSKAKILDFGQTAK